MDWPRDSLADIGAIRNATAFAVNTMCKKFLPAAFFMAYQVLFML
jgi:hypothetical protein